MEGNLYQLIKSRKSRPLAGGLVASIFKQVVDGLHHIHTSGYFHRDMKPENLLVTTTGIADYAPVIQPHPSGVAVEKDVMVIIKLADFGLARETASRPPYTEYVSTRWYRAPEILLHSRDYGAPVDLWALGTIMVELVRLRPLFPGQGEIDQIIRICQFLGDPSDEYGVDPRGKSLGGGPWEEGVRIASKVGFTFPKVAYSMGTREIFTNPMTQNTPTPIESLFDASIPVSLVECIADLLKFDPASRLTVQECLDHRYFVETRSSMAVPVQSTPQHLTIQTDLNGHGTAQTNGNQAAKNSRLTAAPSVISISPRSVPPSHSNSPHASVKHSHLFPPYQHGIPPVPTIPERIPFYQRAQGEQLSPNITSNGQRNPLDYSEDMSVVETNGHIDSPYRNGNYPIPNGHPDANGIHSWPQVEQQGVNGWDASNQFAQHNANMGRQYPEHDISRSLDSHMIADPTGQSNTNGQQGKTGKFASLSMGKKRGWGFGSMFGGNSEKHQLPPVDEVHVESSTSTPSLRRPQSGSTTDSRSLPDISPTSNPPPPAVVITSAQEQKRIKKEAERMAREAERQRRQLADRAYRDQARQVLLKRSQLLKVEGETQDLDWLGVSAQRNSLALRGAGYIRQNKGKQPMYPSTVSAAGARYGNAGHHQEPSTQWADERRMSDQTDHRHSEYRNKARRRDTDDDHSMASSDMNGVKRMSRISFATVDSDPGPPRPLRHRPSVYNHKTISRAPSHNSLQALSVSSSHRALSPSGVSTTSTDGQLAAEMGALHAFGSVSPSPSQLSLSPGTRNGQWPSSAASFTSLQSHQSHEDLHYSASLQPIGQPLPYQPTPIIDISKRKMMPPSNIQLPGVASFDAWQQHPNLPGTISPGLGPYDHVMFSGMSSPSSPGDISPGITALHYHVSCFHPERVYLTDVFV